MVPQPSCPYCAAHSEKTLLIDNGSNRYSCSRCIEKVRNIELAIKKENSLEKLNQLKCELNRVNHFQEFFGITCVCPSDSCPGKFVPINCVDTEAICYHEKELLRVKELLKDFVAVRHSYKFKKPEEFLSALPLRCPYCDFEFTPAVGLKLETGFKGKGGHFTGLPPMYIWTKAEQSILDEKDNNDQYLKDQIIDMTSCSINEQIFAKQRLDILINETIVRMSKLHKKTVNSLVTWYFNAAAVKWMVEFWHDAERYFFGCVELDRSLTQKEKFYYNHIYKNNKQYLTKKMTHIVRGEESAVHQTFFSIWMDLLEANIAEFAQLDPKITCLGDFAWFCHRPKFSEGPESSFLGRVNSKLRIENNSGIISEGPHVPRIARVLSVQKLGEEKNYICDIKSCEWQALQLNQNTELNEGDVVEVRALFMPGHPTHAPIQRLIRYRTKIILPLVKRVLSEEENGECDRKFWSNWKQSVTKAKSIMNLR